MSHPFERSRRHEDYSEADLVRGLQKLTSDLLPNSGAYSLEVSGVRLSPSMHRTLEACSNTPLDADAGITLCAGFDSYLERLHILSLKAQTRHGDDAAFVGSPLGYVSLLTSRETGEPLPGQVFSILPTSTVEALQHEVQFNTPPVTEAGAYRLWLSRFVTEHKGWSVQESMGLYEGIYDHGEETQSTYELTISKTQRVGKGTREEISALRHTLRTPRTAAQSGDNNVIEETVSAWTDFSQPTQTAVVLQAYREVIDPFIVDHSTPGGVPTQRFEAHERRLELDSDHLLRFKKYIEIAQDERQKLENIPNN